MTVYDGNDQKLLSIGFSVDDIEDIRNNIHNFFTPQVIEKMVHDFIYIIGIGLVATIAVSWGLWREYQLYLHWMRESQ